MRSSPSDYFLPSEIRSPDYVRTTSADNVLQQSGYGEKILSDNARTVLLRYQDDIDMLSSRMDESLHGRAQFINETAFDEVLCCYPQVPRSFLKDELPVPIANLSATALLIST